MFPKTTFSCLSTLEKPTALTLVQVHLKLTRRLRKTRSFTLLTIQSLLHYFEFFFFFLPLIRFFLRFEKLSAAVTFDERVFKRVIRLEWVASSVVLLIRGHLTGQWCTPPVALPPLTSEQTPRAPTRAAHVGQLTPSAETSGPFGSWAPLLLARRVVVETPSTLVVVETCLVVVAVAAETSWTRCVRAATLVGARMLELSMVSSWTPLQSAARAAERNASTLLLRVTSLSRMSFIETLEGMRRFFEDFWEGYLRREELAGEVCGLRFLGGVLMVELMCWIGRCFDISDDRCTVASKDIRIRNRICCNICIYILMTPVLKHADSIESFYGYKIASTYLDQF